MNAKHFMQVEATTEWSE